MTGSDGPENVAIRIIAVMAIGGFLQKACSSLGSVRKLCLVDVVSLVDVFAAPDRTSIPNIVVRSCVPILSRHLIGALNIAIGKLIGLAEWVIRSKQRVTLILLSS